MVRQPLRSGLSFVEVMFAVILLGIGFIMIAGLFPVSIQQSKLNVEEAAAATVSRSAMNTLQQVALSASKYTFFSTSPNPLATPPEPAQVVDAFTVGGGGAASESLWEKVKGNLIFADDARYAWVPLYMRDGRSPYAQVFFFVIQNRNHGAYDRTQDLERWANGAMNTNGSPPTLSPPARVPAAGLQMQFRQNYSGFGADAVVLLKGPGGNQAVPWMADGAFILIADDGNAGTLNGRYFKLGNRRPELEDTQHEVWELAPGFGLRPDNSDSMGYSGAAYPNAPNFVYIIGRGLKDPKNPQTAQYTGPAQDIALFTGIIRVN